MAQPQYTEQPRITNPRRARTATHSRIVKNHRARYESIVRVGAVLGIVLVGLLAYVMLVSNITSASYALAKAQHQREALLEQTSRLDEQLAKMHSDDRLAGIAAKLGMKQAQTFAVIQLDAPVAKASSYPVLDSIAGLFGVGPSRPHTR